MKNRFYVHRLTKVLDEFVLTAGLTLHLSDEMMTPRLDPSQVESARSIADGLGLSMGAKTTDGVTTLSFRKR